MKDETPSPFDAYVRMRLDAWGREFRLDRDVARLGFSSQNALKSLIDFRGKVPKATGYKPESVDPLAMQIEDVIRGMHIIDRLTGCVMRAYYCGSGRVGVERRIQAGELFGSKIAHNRYFNAHKRGFGFVGSALSQVSRAA